MPACVNIGRWIWIISRPLLSKWSQWLFYCHLRQFNTGFYILVPSCCNAPNLIWTMCLLTITILSVLWGLLETNHKGICSLIMREGGCKMVLLLLLVFCLFTRFWGLSHGQTNHLQSSKLFCFAVHSEEIWLLRMLSGLRRLECCQLNCNPRLFNPDLGLDPISRTEIGKA